MPRFAANLTMMFNEHDFLDRFQAAADAGFEAVEYLFPYDYSPDVIAQRLAAAGLKQALFNMPPGDWTAGERGLAALPGREKEFHGSVQKAVDYARAIGTPLLHMMAGIADASDDRAINAYKDALIFAADTARAAGVGLVIEPINGRDMPGYFLNNFGRAIELIKELNHGNVKLQFDIYHRQIMHGDVLTGLAEMMPLIGHVQIASVPGRHEPGSGELDDFKIFKALDALGYDGYVGCEYRPEGATLNGLSWMKNI
jgi:2-dehydrotetronate isomerase